MEYTIEKGMRVASEAVWRPLLQCAVSGMDTGSLDEGRAACLMLLAAHGVPDAVRELVYWIQVEYAQPLSELVPGAAVRALTWPGPEVDVWRDPSPVVADGRFLVFGRSVRGTSSRRRAARDDVLITLDDDFAVVTSTVISDETGMAGRFDDVRPFLLGGRLHATFRLYDPDADEWTRAGIVEIEDGAYRALRAFGPRAGYFQQGWAPIATDAGPRFIAWWEPTEVMRWDDVSESFPREAQRLASRVAERFSTGSPGVPVPGGYLLLVNETTTLEDGDEVIFSRFARIDDGFHLTDISPQFFLADRGRDIATGLARRGGQLIAGFTVGEASAVLVTMDLGAALATLMPVAAAGRRRQDGKTARRQDGKSRAESR